MNNVDPRAIVDPSAKIADDVEIGPWTLIGPNVEIGAGSVIASHVVIKGPTTIGERNRIYQFSTIGDDTPDLKFKGEDTTLTIGDDNVIREGVTIHRGTVQDRGDTTIGNHNLIMAYAHVGHDSVVGDHCILVNNASLAGHVHVGDWAILGGYTLVHQFVNIGAHCFTGMNAVLRMDLPAYVTVAGHPAKPAGINSEGLKRRGFSKEAISAIRKAYKIVYRQGLPLAEAQEQLAELAQQHPEVQAFYDSIARSQRGITR